MLRTLQLARLDYNIATYKHVMPCWRNELLTQKSVIRSKVIKGTLVHHNNIASRRKKSQSIVQTFAGVE